MGRWSVCCCCTGWSGGCGIAARRRQFPDGVLKLYNRSMRAACAMVLSAVILPASDFQIDHVTVAGSDIRKLQAAPPGFQPSRDRKGAEAQRRTNPPGPARRVILGSDPNRISGRM